MLAWKMVSICQSSRVGVHQRTEERFVGWCPGDGGWVGASPGWCVPIAPKRAVRVSPGLAAWPAAAAVFATIVVVVVAEEEVAVLRQPIVVESLAASVVSTVARTRFSHHGVPMLFFSLHQWRNGMHKGIPIADRVWKCRHGKKQSTQVSHLWHRERTLINGIQYIKAQSQLPKSMQRQGVREPRISQVHLQGSSKKVVQYVIGKVELGIE